MTMKCEALPRYSFDYVLPGYRDAARFFPLRQTAAARRPMMSTYRLRVESISSMDGKHHDPSVRAQFFARTGNIPGLTTFSFLK